MVGYPTALVSVLSFLDAKDKLAVSRIHQVWYDAARYIDSWRPRAATPLLDCPVELPTPQSCAVVMRHVTIKGPLSDSLAELRLSDSSGIANSAVKATAAQQVLQRLLADMCTAPFAEALWDARQIRIFALTQYFPVVFLLLFLYPLPPELSFHGELPEGVDQEISRESPVGLWEQCFALCVAPEGISLADPLVLQWLATILRCVALRCVDIRAFLGSRLYLVALSRAIVNTAIAMHQAACTSPVVALRAIVAHALQSVCIVDAAGETHCLVLRSNPRAMVSLANLRVTLTSLKDQLSACLRSLS